MIRSIAIGGAFALVLAACTSDAGTTTIAAVTATSSAPDEGGEESTTIPTVTKVDPADAECTALWPEEVIRAAAGEGFAYFDSTSDGSGCTYAEGNTSVAVFFRDGGQSDFDATKDGVAATSEITELDLCDGAFSVTLTPAIGVIEALDIESNRIFNATVNGLEDPIDIATELIAAAC